VVALAVTRPGFRPLIRYRWRKYAERSLPCCSTTHMKSRRGDSDSNAGSEPSTKLHEQSHMPDVRLAAWFQLPRRRRRGAMVIQIPYGLWPHCHYSGLLQSGHVPAVAAIFPCSQQPMLLSQAAGATDSDVKFAVGGIWPRASSHSVSPPNNMLFMNMCGKSCLWNRRKPISQRWGSWAEIEPPESVHTPPRSS